jgi:PDZ domain-containing protein
MKRRGATLLAGIVLLAALVAGGWNTKVPYVALGPGPTYDTLGSSGGANSKQVIQITGTKTYPSAGQLRMVTVGVAPELTLADALRGWFDRDEAIWPRELVYPPNQTEQEVDQKNQQDFVRSQSSAETVALRQLGYPVQVRVTEVNAGFPAAGKLQVGDIITSIDGEPVTSGEKLLQAIRSKPAGVNHTFGYTRHGQAGTVTLAPKAGEGNVPQIGVTTEQLQPHPFEIHIELAGIGGPSAGLMFALGVTDKLTPLDITGGMHIAGTGEIDDEGNVGVIGGIPQKMIAAKDDGATVFLVPAGNCAEAVANAVPGLQLVKVETFSGALKELETLRDHGKPTPCTAG